MKTPIEVLITTFEVLNEGSIKTGTANPQADIDYVIKVLNTGLDYEREYIEHRIKKENA